MFDSYAMQALEVRLEQKRSRDWNVEWNFEKFVKMKWFLFQYEYFQIS